MDKEVKLNVVAKEGEVKLLTGKNFYTLEDHTSAEFKTECIKSFVNYVKTSVNTNTANVFYERSAAYCVSTEVEYNTKPLADLTMKISTILEKVIRLNSNEKSAGDMDEILTYLRPYFNTGASTFLTKVRSTIVKAVTECERMTDDFGNYKYMVTRKGLGREELGIPERITVIVPVYELLDETIEIEFEPLFNFVETGDQKEPVKLTWTLRCSTLDEQIKAAQLVIMRKYFEPLCQENCLYGTLAIHQATDNWKYKESSGPVI